MKRYRERSKDVTGNVSVTPPDTDTETDTETDSDAANAAPRERANAADGPFPAAY